MIMPKIEAHVMTPEQVSFIEWSPVVWLDASPRLLMSGPNAGKYIVAQEFNDAAYSQVKAAVAGIPTDTVEMIEFYRAWSGAGEPYSVGDIVAHDGFIYENIQEHTSQIDWSPGVALSLWVRDDTYGGTVIPEWSQPAGAHDAYNTGDMVTYSGQTWESTIDANVWAPGVYGWVVVSG